MRVIFIHGPAAAGKYTIGSLLSKTLGIPLFHNHLTVDLVSSLFEFGTAEFCQLRESIWLEAFTKAAATNTSFIFTFNPEASVAPDLVSRLQSRIEEYGGDVQYIELVCPEAEILNRLGTEDRAKFGKLNDSDLYLQLLANGSFDYPELPTAKMQINTGNFSAHAAAEKIARELREP